MSATGIAEILKVFTTVYGEPLPLTPEPEHTLDAAEASLGFPLPKLLREYYELTSHTDRVNSVNDRLLAPARLEVLDGALKFYVENQGVMYWGILKRNLKKKDPPVHFAYNDNEEKLTWSIQCDKLSEFLLSMLYWQAVNGALANYALAWVKPTSRSLLAHRWPLLLNVEKPPWQAYGGAGLVICLLGDDDELQIQVGSRTAAELEALEQSLAIEWDVREAVPPR